MLGTFIQSTNPLPQFINSKLFVIFLYHSIIINLLYLELTTLNNKGLLLNILISIFNGYLLESYDSITPF